MAAPYVQVFPLPKPIDGETQLTSVVMDQADFDAFCDDLEANDICDASSAAAERAPIKQAVAAIRATKHLPLMKRGTKTKIFFDRYSIKTNLASFIVRGQGLKIVEQFMKDTGRIL